jgi:Spy/CpxP family protein refolding chaperone
MIRRTWLSAIAVALVAGLSVGAAHAQPLAPGGKQGGHSGHERMQKKLGLTDEQAKQMRDVMTAQKDAQRKNGQALRDANQELRRLALSGADDATLRAKQTDVANLMAESVRLKVEGLKQIAPILTPEQRQKLAEMRMDHHRGRGHRGGPKTQGQQG